jgi:hypothetical protein
MQMPSSQDYRSTSIEREILSEQPKPGPHFTAANIFVSMIAIGVVLILIYVIFNYNIFLYIPRNSMLYQLFGSGHLAQVSPLVSTLSQYSNDSGNVNASYTGSLYLAVYDPQGQASGIIIPFYLRYEKSGDNSRMDVNISPDSYLLGGTNFSFIHISNNHNYTCSSETSGFNLVSCINETSNPNASTADLESLNSLLGGVNSSVKLEGQSFFKNNICSIVSGSENGGIPLNGSFGLGSKIGASSPYAVQFKLVLSLFRELNLNGNFTSCVSDIYYLPLNLTAKTNINLTSVTSSQPTRLYTKLSLDEFAINAKPSMKYIATLPGPLVNESFVNVGYDTLSSCLASAGFTCGNPVYLGSDANMIVTLSQSSGSNWLNASFVFVPDGTPIANDSLPDISFNSSPANTVFEYNGLMQGEQVQLYLPVNGVSQPLAPGSSILGTIWGAYTSAYYNTTQYAEIGVIKASAVP